LVFVKMGTRLSEEDKLRGQTELYLVRLRTQRQRPDEYTQTGRSCRKSEDRGSLKNQQLEKAQTGRKGGSGKRPAEEDDGLNTWARGWAKLGEARNGAESKKLKRQDILKGTNGGGTCLKKRLGGKKKTSRGRAQLGDASQKREWSKAPALAPKYPGD